MLFFSKALLAVVVALLGLASAAVIPEGTVEFQDRSSKIIVTAVNKCKHSFAPVFSPPLPGRSAWPTLTSGKSSQHTFKSDKYKGKVFSPLRKANTTSGNGATWGEMDLESGDYNISLEGGYNVPLFLWNQGRQFRGYCTPAHCNGEECKDAYRKPSGLMKGARAGSDTRTPNHSCPPSFANWIVQFC